MKIGLIGLQNSGKTTIFNALTNSNIEVTSYSSMQNEMNMAVVEVLDERINKLTEMYKPKKTIFAHIDYVDFGGFSEGAAKSGLFSPELMGVIKTTDALAVVVRNFDDEIISQSQGKPNPQNDIDQIDSELIISDLIVAEKRLEKLLLSYKRGIKTASLQIEEKALRKIIDALNETIPIRDIDLTSDEEKSVRGFQFLSQKPIMIIVNSSEDSVNTQAELIESLSKNYSVIEFAGKFEMELVNLSEEDKEMFMEDMGITESAKARLTKFSYDLLGYLSFFTVGTDEVRAWTIVNGNNAVEAAGKIHSDLARGFIRAECFSYNDLMVCGSERVLREKGLFKLEGKDYKVKDGDILNIRFNV